MEKIISEKSFEKARANIVGQKKNNPESEIVFSSYDDDLNRKVLEKLEIDIFVPLLGARKDWQKQRNSGLDNVMAKIAKSDGIVIGINFDEILECKNLKDKAEILARVKQNIDLCRRNKLKMKFVFFSEGSSRNVYDLKALGLVLGMPTWMVKGL